MLSQLTQAAVSRGVQIETSADEDLLAIYRDAIDAIYMLFFSVHLPDLTPKALRILADDLGQILFGVAKMRMAKSTAIQMLNTSDSVIELVTRARNKIYEASKLVTAQDLNTDERQTLFDEKIQQCQSYLWQARERFDIT